MARPERKTVDYFPHYISDGKKMFYIEQTYGNDGYATWFKILELLASTDNHYLNLNSKTDILFLSARCKVPKEVLINILNDLCELNEIDHYLWQNNIVYSHKFIESIQDAYARRSNNCMNYDTICMHLLGLCTTITPLEYIKKYGNTQSKVKYIKVNESKGNNTETPTDNFGENSDENQQPQETPPQIDFDLTDEQKIEKEFTTRLKKARNMPNSDFMDLQLPELKLGIVSQKLTLMNLGNEVEDEQVITLWNIFKGTYFTGEKYYKSLNEIYSHFINSVKMPVGGIKNLPNPKKEEIPRYTRAQIAVIQSQGNPLPMKYEIIEN